MHHHVTDAIYQQAAEAVGQANAEYTTRKNGLIVRTAPIDEAVQVIVTSALRDCLLYHSTYLVMVSHPGQQ